MTETSLCSATEMTVDQPAERREYNVVGPWDDPYKTFKVCGNVFVCPTLYAPIKPVGKGAYGIVCSAKNTETGEHVAIKNIKNAFDNQIDSKRTIREIRLLRQLQHENIITIRDLIAPPDPESFNNVYVVYDLMDTDLHQIIKSNQPLSDEHFQYFIYQVLRGLRYIHSANILHRDLKPSNLFLNSNCDLKIGDFGLARTSASPDAHYTEYVVTRYYRAPELLLQCQEYTAAIDVWSVGCIFAELLGRKPCFPGKDYIHQLNLITRILGTPTDNDLGFLKNDNAKHYLHTLPRCDTVSWQHVFPNAKPLALDLLSKMLVFDPAKRITVNEAIQHPYLASLHDANDEPVCEHLFNVEFEHELQSANDARRMILEECISFHPLLHSRLAPAMERLRQAGARPLAPAASVPTSMSMS